MNKEYGAFVPLKEYKELIIAKERLEQMNVDYESFSKEAKEFHDKLAKVEEELKELLLVVTDNKEKPSYPGNFEGYDMANVHTIAKYINENYLTEDKKLSFRKVLHEEKEVKEEGTKNE